MIGRILNLELTHNVVGYCEGEVCRCAAEIQGFTRSEASPRISFRIERDQTETGCGKKPDL